MFEKIYDCLTGRCVRRIDFPNAPENTVYLTFDDGPDSECTPKILDLLEAEKIQATFFVIASKAQEQTELLKRIQAQGHTIGNHSLDHNTKKYFQSYATLKKWIEDAHAILPQSIAFRSPVGIKTPALNKILHEKKWPLVLWNIRFYDTNYSLTESAVKKKSQKISSGSIILLHDTHHTQQEMFLKNLKMLIRNCKSKGLKFRALDRELVWKSYIEKYEK